jgi:hypothetical protein
MATDTTTGGSTLPPNAPDMRSSLTEALAQADAAAAARIQELQRVYQARASQLSRMAADVKAQPGATADEVARAEAAVSSALAVSAQLGLVHRQFTTPEPSVPAAGWVLHGHVYKTTSSAEPAPVRGFTVFLVDAAQTYQQAYGFAYTDEAGYFVLKYEGGDAASARAATDLFVEVADLKARPVYLSRTAFQPAAGAATYQDIILRESDQPLGEAPAGARKTAKPPKPKG